MKTPTQSASLSATEPVSPTDPLAQTDPELAAYFNNFAFNEVPAESAMAPTTRLMLQLAATIAAPALNEFKAMAGVALAAGVTAVEIKEITYQAVPYVGMARARDFILGANEVFTAHGIGLPLPGQPTTTPETRSAAGLAVQTLIGGADPQVAGHVAANLNVGNTRAMLVDTLTQILPLIGYPRTLNGLRIVNEGTP